MSAKTDAEVIIGGKVYTLSGYESEEYLQKVASYINNKRNEYDALEGYKRLPVDMQSTLLELNIADDYFKAKSQVEKLEQDLEAKEKEIYDLRHDLISNQIKMESDEKALKELEKENKELLLNKTKLEANLEDALLGKVPGQKKEDNEKKENIPSNAMAAEEMAVSDKEESKDTEHNKAGQDKKHL